MFIIVLIVIVGSMVVSVIGFVGIVVMGLFKLIFVKDWKDKKNV